MMIAGESNANKETKKLASKRIRESSRAKWGGNANTESSGLARQVRGC